MDGCDMPLPRERVRWCPRCGSVARVPAELDGVDVGCRTCEGIYQERHTRRAIRRSLRAMDVVEQHG